MVAFVCFFFRIILVYQSSSLSEKLLKNLVVRKKGYRKKRLPSHHSWTKNCSLEITHPRNIFNHYVFMTCACAIKNIKFFLLVNTLHLLQYFKNYFKAVPVKRSVNLRNKHSLDKFSCKDFKRWLEPVISLLRAWWPIFIAYFESLYCREQKRKVEKYQNLNIYIKGNTLRVISVHRDMTDKHIKFPRPHHWTWTWTFELELYLLFIYIYIITKLLAPATSNID